MSRYRASFRLMVDVEFDDDGQHALPDLAFEAVEDLLPINHGFEVELIASSVEPATRPTPRTGDETL